MENKLFDKRFVYFMWDNVLEGKDVFEADAIGLLRDNVNNHSDMSKVYENRNDKLYPFVRLNDELKFKFVYYDPNYNFKKAFLDGNVVEYKTNNSWKKAVDFDVLISALNDGCQARIKSKQIISDEIRAAFERGEKIEYRYKGTKDWKWFSKETCNTDFEFQENIEYKLPEYVPFSTVAVTVNVPFATVTVNVLLSAAL